MYTVYMLCAKFGFGQSSDCPRKLRIRALRGQSPDCPRPRPCTTNVVHMYVQSFARVRSLCMLVGDWCIVKRSTEKDWHSVCPVRSDFIRNARRFLLQFLLKRLLGVIALVHCNVFYFFDFCILFLCCAFWDPAISLIFVLYFFAVLYQQQYRSQAVHVQTRY